MFGIEGEGPDQQVGGQAGDAAWTLAGDLPLSRTWTGPDQIFDEFIPAMFARLVPGTVELEFRA